jgi:ribosomal-protein-alanine N-acetyltransferase
MAARSADDARPLVRPAVARDVDHVVAIERASFADPWSREAFVQALDGRGVRFDVACDASGAVIGYVIAWTVADEGEIANLAIAPAARGRGLAAKLLDGVLAAARAQEVTTLHLEVRESNHAARALYARFGFREAGRRRAYYRQPVEDALVLRLELGAAP